MSIKIVLPTNDGIKCGRGTQVFTEGGEEITNISSIEITIEPNDCIMATIRLPVAKMINTDGLLPVLSPESIKQIEALGYKVIGK